MQPRKVLHKQPQPLSALRPDEFSTMRPKAGGWVCLNFETFLGCGILLGVSLLSHPSTLLSVEFVEFIHPFFRCQFLSVLSVLSVRLSTKCFKWGQCEGVVRQGWSWCPSDFLNPLPRLLLQKVFTRIDAHVKGRSNNFLWMRPRPPHPPMKNPHQSRQGLKWLVACFGWMVCRSRVALQQSLLSSHQTR